MESYVVGDELWDDMMCVKDTSLLEATMAKGKWNTKVGGTLIVIKQS